MEELEHTEELHQGWQTNYPSLEEHANLVSKQFGQEEVEGFMVQTTVGAALDEYGDELNIASTGPLRRKVARTKFV